MQKKLAYIFTLILLTGICPAYTDVLVLEDGDSISGHVVRISDGILVFRTQLKGQMMAHMDTIRELNTDLPQMLTLRDPELDAYGKLTSVGGKPHLLPITGGDAVPIDLSRIMQASPIPASTQTEDDSPKISVQTGVMSRIGTQNSTDLYARIGLETETPKVLVQMDNILQRADSDAFPGYFSSQTSLTGLGDSPWQPTAQLGVERDTDNALDLRTDLSLGVQYAFNTPENSTLDALIGLNYAYEDWHNRQADWGREDRRNDHELNLKLGLRYSKAIAEDTTLNGELALLPSLTDFGAFRANSKAYLQKNLTNQLHLRLDLMLNYDSDPAFNALQPWTTGIGAGIGWQF